MPGMCFPHIPNTSADLSGLKSIFGFWRFARRLDPSSCTEGAHPSNFNSGICTFWASLLKESQIQSSRKTPNPEIRLQSARFGIRIWIVLENAPPGKVFFDPRFNRRAKRQTSKIEFKPLNVTLDVWAFACGVLFRTKTCGRTPCVNVVPRSMQDAGLVC